jgi:hypothetical protein
MYLVDIVLYVFSSSFSIYIYNYTFTIKKKVMGTKGNIWNIYKLSIRLLNKFFYIQELKIEPLITCVSAMIWGVRLNLECNYQAIKVLGTYYGFSMCFCEKKKCAPSWCLWCCIYRSVVWDNRKNSWDIIPSSGVMME